MGNYDKSFEDLKKAKKLAAQLREKQ